MTFELARSTLYRWRVDPVSFVKEALGATPEEWQAEVLNAVVANDRITIRSGHGVGKTSLLAFICLWWLLTRYPCKIAATSPTAHQLFDVLLPEISYWRRRLPPQLAQQLAMKADRVELTGAPKESFLVARTSRAETPEALQGFHSEHMLYIVDEASIVPDEIFEVARGAMSTAGAKTIMAGNPNKASGYFYESHRPGSPYISFKVHCEESSRVDPKFIEEMKRDYGEESNIYRVRVAGEFPTEDDDVLIGMGLLEGAVARFKILNEAVEDAEDMNTVVLEARPKVPKSGRAPLPFKGKASPYTVIWGLDVARYGPDRSVLVERRGRTVPLVASWMKLSTMELAGRIVSLWESRNDIDKPESIFIDSIGIGSGVLDRLLEKELPAVGINVAELPGISGEGFRLRDELFLRMRDFFILRDAALIDHKELVRDISSITFKFGSDGRQRILSKELLRKKLGRSPDHADALALTFADGPVGLISPISSKAGEGAWGKRATVDAAWVA